MGLQVCEECHCVLWCSVTGNEYFPDDPHAKNCPSRNREHKDVGNFTCKVCKKKCGGLVNDKYCMKCWDEKNET